MDKKTTNSQLQDGIGVLQVSQHSGNFTCNESSVLQSVLLMQYFS